MNIPAPRAGKRSTSISGSVSISQTADSQAFTIFSGSPRHFFDTTASVGTVEVNLQGCAVLDWQTSKTSQGNFHFTHSFYAEAIPFCWLQTLSDCSSIEEART